MQYFSQVFMVFFSSPEFSCWDSSRKRCWVSSLVGGLTSSKHFLDIYSSSASLPPPIVSLFSVDFETNTSCTETPSCVCDRDFFPSLSPLTLDLFQHSSQYLDELHNVLSASMSLPVSAVTKICFWKMREHSRTNLLLYSVSRLTQVVLEF